MKPVVFHGHNVVFRAPKDWDEERQGPCVPLAVCRDQNGGTLTTVWKPTLRERISLLFGGYIQVCLYSRFLPPSWVDIVRTKEVPPVEDM